MDPSWQADARRAVRMGLLRRRMPAFHLLARRRLWQLRRFWHLQRQQDLLALHAGRFGLLHYGSLATQGTAHGQWDAVRTAAGTAHGQWDAVRTAAVPSVFVLSCVLGFVEYHERLWPAPTLGILLLVLVLPRILSGCVLIPTAIARHLPDSLLGASGAAIRLPAPIAASLVVLLHLRHGHVCHRLALRFRVEVLAPLARTVSAGRRIPWPLLPNQG
eukprot:s5317_g3.t1